MSFPGADADTFAVQELQRCASWMEPACDGEILRGVYLKLMVHCW